MNVRHARLGIDIGRVIIDGPAHPGDRDTAFFSGTEADMAIRGAVAAIARLTARLGGRVWLVSKCGPRIQARTLRWLAAHDFHARTGVPTEQVRFCRARADKRTHCLDLGLTHFVDDHPEVHAAIRGAVAYQYFFGPQRRPVPAYGVHTPTWADVERCVEASLAGQPSAAPLTADAVSHGDASNRA